MLEIWPAALAPINDGFFVLLRPDRGCENLAAHDSYSDIVLFLYLRLDNEGGQRNGIFVGFYPVSTDGLKRAENFRSCLATLRRIRGL